MGAWRAAFSCPNCSVWLAPSKCFMILTNIGLALIALGTISVIIRVLFDMTTAYYLTLLFIGAGLLLFIVGVMNVKLKIDN